MMWRFITSLILGLGVITSSQAQESGPTVDWAKIDCQSSPLSREAADLCVQRRQAQAAEDTVWWMQVGTFFVVATLMANCWAAVAASLAARTSAKHFIADRRPWLEVSCLSLHHDASIQPDGRLSIGFDIEVSNRGNSPAEEVVVGLRVFDDMMVAADYARNVTKPNDVTFSQPVFPSQHDHVRIGSAGNFDGTPQPALGGMVWIGGSVFYRFSAGGGEYRTPFVYRLQRADAQPLRDFAHIPRADLITVWSYPPNPS